MPVPAPPFSALAGVLQEQIDLLAGLQDLLAQEARALVSPGQEKILELAATKQRLGNRLAELSLELDGLLGGSTPSPEQGSLGLDLGERLARRVGAAPDDAGLRALHQRALAALEGCLTDNRTIGALVERRRSAVERALRIFFEEPEGTPVYQASGRLPTAGSSNHLIGEA